MKTTSLLEDLKNLLGQNYCFFCGKIEEIVCTKCTIDLFKYSAIQYIQNVPVL